MYNIPKLYMYDQNDVVKSISGTYKDPNSSKRYYEELLDEGYKLITPASNYLKFNKIGITKYMKYTSQYNFKLAIIDDGKAGYNPDLFNFRKNVEVIDVFEDTCKCSHLTTGKSHMQSMMDAWYQGYSGNLTMYVYDYDYKRDSGNSCDWSYALEDAIAKDVDLICISASFSGSWTAEYLKQFFREAERQGIIVMTSVGNYDVVNYPAEDIDGYEMAIAIGASSLKNDGKIYYATYSAISEYIDFSALSEFKTRYLNKYGKVDWTNSSGSSLACQIAGMQFAYMVSDLARQYNFKDRFPMSNPFARELISQNLVDINTQGFDYKTGHGLIVLK